MKQEHNFEDEYYDADRYDSAEGWEPENKYQKQAQDHRKKHPEEFCHDSMLEVRDANECMHSTATDQTPTDLFGGLWRTGELAVLFAESGAGKSVLAVQIAESIARGRRLETGAQRLENLTSPVSRLPSPVSPAQPVLYLDLQHSPAQFTERYSCPHPIPGKLPVKYRFSNKLRIARIGEIDIPEAFKGDLARYFKHSLKRTIENAEAKVIVIDNLSCLDLKSSGTAAALRWLRSLKLYSMTTGASILVLANSRQKVRIRKSEAGNSYSSLFTIHSSLFTVADSVFAIGRSTFGPDIRYIKHLRSVGEQPASRRPAALSSSTEHSALSTVHSNDVLVYQIERSEGPARVSSPHVSKGPIPPTALASPVSSLSSPVPKLPAGPFLGLTFLGTAPESDLIRDYEREYHDAEAREQKRINTATNSDRAKRLHSRDILVDGILDGSYQRYIKGE